MRDRRDWQYDLADRRLEHINPNIEHGRSNPVCIAERCPDAMPHAPYWTEARYAVKG